MVFLKKKGIQPGVHSYVITALSYMALGLFSSLIMGLMMQTAGERMLMPYWAEGGQFLVDMGELAMSLMGPAIGVAIAYGLKAPPLVIFSAVVTGAAGAELAGPAGSYLAALLSVEIGKLVSGETKVDIIVTPFVTIATGYFTAGLIGPPVAATLEQFGSFIMWATTQQPLAMGALVAVLMGLALTAPISSAALAFMLGLDGLAAGAAAVGCSAQMIGFAVSSYRENKFGGLIALGLGTSMLQIANIIKRPLILIPPTLTAAILGPLATVVFVMENNQAGAGMGTSGFVGPVMAMNVMGTETETLVAIALLFFILPAVISLFLSELLRKMNWIKPGDMTIPKG
ncbi:PTS transporter subunit IIC [Salisediminibacterium selenitireducens]|uniref:Phosphotransferase system EIIC n=1 Tax=Bacillus selenitireducens (strain ATCC 700615 / DSM 15326 / MLS10) TaxID=439292 RepID=D6XSI8_BACIE|nr:PTS sugar transporter subunit IIC [Salisediminibacterium selenitireducens]ADH98774.1 phosphotransferase system EIIC [[Bacillus] selenitireducens MLS10]